MGIYKCCAVAFSLYIILSAVLPTMKGQSLGWRKRGDYFYYFSDEAPNQNTARQLCLGLGADLLSISTQEENDYIAEEITIGFWFGLKTENPCNNCGTSNRDGCETCRNRWSWYDGTAYSFQNWEQNEPNNRNRCARLFHNGEWRDESCENHYRYICKTKDPCMRSICNNGSCESGVDLVDLYQCSCYDGYEGDHCDIDIDECRSNPCQNEAFCTHQINSYTCACKNGFTGIHCETNIDDCIEHDCQNGASCVDRIDAYSCSCVEGFTGQKCETNIDDCESMPCQHGATCIDRIANYTCECQPTRIGRNCSQDFDECSDSSKDQSCLHGNCTNFDGGYNCTCFEGFSGEKCSQNGMGDKHGREEDEGDNLEDLQMTLYVAASLASVAFLIALAMLINDRYEVKMLEKRKTVQRAENRNIEQN